MVVAFSGGRVRDGSVLRRCDGARLGGAETETLMPPNGRRILGDTRALLNLVIAEAERLLGVCDRVEAEAGARPVSSNAGKLLVKYSYDHPDPAYRCSDDPMDYLAPSGAHRSWHKRHPEFGPPCAKSKSEFNWETAQSKAQKPLPTWTPTIRPVWRCGGYWEYDRFQRAHKGRHQTAGTEPCPASVAEDTGDQLRKQARRRGDLDYQWEPKAGASIRRHMWMDQNLRFLAPLLVFGTAGTEAVNGPVSKVKERVRKVPGGREITDWWEYPDQPGRINPPTPPAQRRRTARPPARCGTPAGYQAHRSRGEHACGFCVDAQRKVWREGWAARAAVEKRKRDEAKQADADRWKEWQTQRDKEVV